MTGVGAVYVRQIKSKGGDIHMKLAKRIICIFSIVVSGFILFQSCAAGIANSLQDNGSSSGTGGVILVVFMLVGAILGLSSHEHKPMIVSGAFYIVGGFLALMLEAGTFADLMIWGIMSIIFGVVIMGIGIMKS